MNHKLLVLVIGNEIVIPSIQERENFPEYNVLILETQNMIVIAKCQLERSLNETLSYCRPGTWGEAVLSKIKNI
jgi:hypothetical protein